MEGQDITTITRGGAAVRRGEPNGDGPGHRVPQTIKARARLDASRPRHGRIDARHMGRADPRYAYLTDSHD
jgi:hypothetical protein